MDTFLKQGLLALAGALALAAAGLYVYGPEGTGLMAGLTALLTLSASLIARSPRQGTIATAMVCVGSNAYLFSRKWDLASRTDAVCNINEVINCDKVNLSAWSEVFGIPITLFGMAFYVGLVLAALMADDRSKRFHQVNTLFAILNVVVSVFLGYQTKVIGAFCVMCVSIYVGNLLLLWAGFAGMRESKTSLSEEIGQIPLSKEFLTISATFLVVFAVGGAGWFAQKQGTTAASPSGEFSAEELAALYHQPSGTLQLAGDEPVLGDSSAPYMVVEFADFGCPHCAAAAKELKHILKDNPKIQLRFRVFPLSGECHPGLSPGDPTRCAAAVAAECANRQGKFWPMLSLLFENQGSFQPDDLHFIAVKSGLDIPSWEACLADPGAASAVLADAKAGDDAGVHGTPTLFLKGTHGDDWVVVRSPDALKTLVEAHQKGTQLLPARPEAPEE